MANNFLELLKDINLHTQGARQIQSIIKRNPHLNTSWSNCRISKKKNLKREKRQTISEGMVDRLPTHTVTVEAQ